MTISRQKRWYPLIAFVLLCSLAGCGLASFVRLSVNDPIKPEDVTFITPGKTTLAEVIAKLGTPDEVVGLNGEAGAVVFYHFLDAKYARVNYGWPLQFVSPASVDMILAGGGLATDVFQVKFDSQWVAQQHAFAKHIHAGQYRLWPFQLEKPHPYQLQQIAF